MEGVFVRVNEGGMTPQEVSSLFNEEGGKSEKVSLFGRPSFGRLRGLVVSVRRVRCDFQPGSEDRSENTAFYTELVRYA